MRKSTVGKYDLFDDILAAMKIEFSNSIQSHDACRMCKTTKKWKMLLGELMPLIKRKR